MKTTKVYHAPGYPVDPKKEEKRAFENLDIYSCVMIHPKPIFLKSETVYIEFESLAEFQAWILRRARYN